MELVIEEVFPKASVNPFLLTFRNGTTNKAFKKAPCMLVENEGHTRKVITAVDNLIYTGEEEQNELVRSLLLVRNKKTGKVRIIETSNAEMTPVLKTNVEGLKLHDTSNLELSRKFGSKKQKKQMEQKEKLKIDTETVAGQMKEVSANITIDKLDMSTYQENDSELIYIPPINTQATRVEDVYELDKILTPDQYESAYSELDGKNYEEDFLPFIKKIAATHKLSERHTVLAVYANALLKIYTTLSKELSKKSFIVCRESTTINDKVLNEFSINTGRRTRPNTLKDKALCHALVCLLIINKFTLELDDLVGATKLAPTTIAFRVRTIRAYISVLPGDTKKAIVLKLPLSSYQSKIRRKSAKF